MAYVLFLWDSCPLSRVVLFFPCPALSVCIQKEWHLFIISCLLLWLQSFWSRRFFFVLCFFALLCSTQRSEISFGFDMLIFGMIPRLLSLQLLKPLSIPHIQIVNNNTNKDIWVCGTFLSFNNVGKRALNTQRLKIWSYLPDSSEGM